MCRQTARSDLVIVYHRQPYEEVEDGGKTVLRENKSPNGIVPTLKSFIGRVDSAVWVAWKQAADPSAPGFERLTEIKDGYGRYRISRVPLTAEQIRSFYCVTSKEAFWPILHGFRDRINYGSVDWPAFRDVNRVFAEAAASDAAEGAVVWIHDYNLWLVPGYLRQIRPDLKISFFHHTPFPAADTFNVLPWRREIIESLLACDVVGFHIPRFAANFAAVAQSLTAAEVTRTKPVRSDLVVDGAALSDRQAPTALSFDGRRVELAASPVGVDVNFIDRQARSPETVSGMASLRNELGPGARLILSVGRTDYTKGGIEQLESFERILSRRPALRGTARLLHVSVSANRQMTAYAGVQSQIKRVADRVNATFGDRNWWPISLISEPIPFKALLAYYRAADVAWITPLADGMNLVCKEYVASRVDEDGVLVLSEFAGASLVLSAAIMTNPFSSQSMDRALLTALDMNREERRDRMRVLRNAVKRNSVTAWAHAQMDTFGGLGAVGGAR